MRNSDGLDYYFVIRSGDKWLNFGFILKVELIDFVDRLDGGVWERGIKDGFKVLVWVMEGWRCFELRRDEGCGGEGLEFGVGYRGW